MGTPYCLSKTFPQSTPLSVDVDVPLAVPPPQLVYCVCKFIVAPPSFRINGATHGHAHARQKTGLHTYPCSIEEISGYGKKSSKFTHRWRFMTIISYEKLFNGNVRDWNAISSKFLMFFHSSCLRVHFLREHNFYSPSLGRIGNEKFFLASPLNPRKGQIELRTWAASAPNAAIHWLGSLSRPTVITFKIDTFFWD